jgi:hypothetical protein
MWVARRFRRRLLILSVSTLGLFISSFSAVLALDFTAPVVSILDGDTIEVLHNHHPERIRLSGVDKCLAVSVAVQLGDSVWGARPAEQGRGSFCLEGRRKFFWLRVVAELRKFCRVFHSSASVNA